MRKLWKVAPPYEGAAVVATLTVARGDIIEVAVARPEDKYGPEEPCLQVEIDQGDSGSWDGCYHSNVLTKLIPLAVLEELLSANGYSLTKH
jgi:hypothetical protein